MDDDASKMLAKIGVERLQAIYAQGQRFSDLRAPFRRYRGRLIEIRYRLDICIFLPSSQVSWNIQQSQRTTAQNVVQRTEDCSVHNSFYQKKGREGNLPK